MLEQRGFLKLAALAVAGFFACLGTADAGNFVIQVYNKDGTLAKDTSTVVVTANTSITQVTKNSYVFANGTHSFGINGASLPTGGKWVTFTITRTGIPAVVTRAYMGTNVDTTVICVVVDNP